MNISELIALLEQKKAEHGDIVVLCLTTADGEAEETMLTATHIHAGQLPKPGSAEMDKALIIG